jgi:hypothetical protein
MAQYHAMNEYISVNDAVKETGRSVSSIRRVLKTFPPESVRRQGKKYFYERVVLYRELGVTLSPDSVVIESENSQTVSENQPDTIASPLIEALKAQINLHIEQLREKDRQIAQLLDRQHETNVLLNQRQLTVQETTPAPAGKTEAEKHREQWIAIACMGVLLLILGLAVWFTWHPLG